MTNDIRTLEDAVTMLSPIVGDYVWMVRCAEDRILRLDFGSPHLEIHGPRASASGSPDVRAALACRIVVPAGAYHLFVENGFWRVEAGGLSCDRSSKETEAARSCLKRFEGQKLVSIDLSRPEKCWIFSFDLGGRLYLGSAADVGDLQSPQTDGSVTDAWTVFFVNQGSLTCIDFDHFRFEPP